MRRTKEQKALDEELLRECGGYYEDDNKPDGAYIQVGWVFYNTNKIKRLIEKGADVHSKKRNGDTPLHLAVDKNNIELAKYLIDSGADVNAKKRNGETPLQMVYSVEVAELLIDSGADVMAKNKWDETPLHWAVFRDNIELAKYLIDSGADVNAKKRNGETPLQMVYSVEVAELLIDSGADVMAKNKNGETTLRFWLIKHLKEATSWGGGRVDIPYDLANILIKAGATF